MGKCFVKLCEAHDSKQQSCAYPYLLLGEHECFYTVGRPIAEYCSVSTNALFFALIISYNHFVCPPYLEVDMSSSPDQRD